MSVLHRKLLLALAGVMAVAMVCCNRADDVVDRTLFETLPESNRVVATTNLDALLKMASCQSERGIITLTPELKRLLSMDSTLLLSLEAMAGQGDWLDLSCVGILKIDTLSDYVLTARRLPDSVLVQQIAVLDDADDERSPKLGEVALWQFENGANMIASEHQVWVSMHPMHTFPQWLDSIISLADRAAVARNRLLSSFLSDSTAMLRVKFDVKEYPNPFGENFNQVYMLNRITERSLNVSLKFGCDNRLVAAFCNMEPVDSIAFDDLPIGARAALAIGLGPEAVKKLPQVLDLLPTRQWLPANMAYSVLSDDGGTISLSAAPGGSAETIRRFSLATWVVKAMIPSGDKGEATADMVNHIGIDDIYAEADSTYLRIWNYDPFTFEYAYRQSTDVEAVVEDGQLAVGYLNIPYRSELMKAVNLRRGYSLRFQVVDSAANATLRILGPSNYVLPAVIQDVNNLRRGFTSQLSTDILCPLNYKQMLNDKYDVANNRA